MNIFSEDYFCEAFGQAYFPDREVASGVFKLKEQLWQLPSFSSSEPIGGSTFIDFFEPLANASQDSGLFPGKVDYLLRVCRQMVTCSDWHSQKLEETFEAAPTTIWSEFSDWDAFVSYVRQHRSNLFSDSRRKQRKLERKVGALKFSFSNFNQEVLDTCFRWKSEQWQQMGVPDRFASAQHRQLFQELAARNLLLVSTLSSDQELLAIHVGMLDKGRLYWWVPAYNPSYSQYSPGRLLLHFLLEESFKRNHREFDFLWGNETYKWFYATHVRLLEDLGQPPIAKQIEKSLKLVLRPFPGTANFLKKVRNRVTRA